MNIIAYKIESYGKDFCTAFSPHKRVSPNFHMSAILVEGDRCNTNPKTLKEFPTFMP